eukprot:6379693-Prymnesium_polylepis.1
MNQKSKKSENGDKDKNTVKVSECHCPRANAPRGGHSVHPRPPTLIRRYRCSRRAQGHISPVRTGGSCDARHCRGSGRQGSATRAHAL